MPFTIDISPSRRPGRKRRQQQPGVLLRNSHAGDELALRRLAALDSRELPAGDFLVAEVGGDLVAALPLDADVSPISDPFRPTAEIVELLELCADSSTSSLRRAA